MKKKLFCLLLPFLLMGCLPACKANTVQQADAEAGEYAMLFGEDRDVVMAALALDESALPVEQAPGFQELNGETEITNQVFAKALLFDVTGEDDMLYGFCYYADLAGDAAKAEAVISGLVSGLTAIHGDPGTYEGLSGRITETKHLGQWLEEKTAARLVENWNLQQDIVLEMTLDRDAGHITVQLVYRQAAA